MKTIKFGLFFVLLLFVPYFSMAQAAKKADKDTDNWRYELQAIDQVAPQGFAQVKVWSYSKKSTVAMEQAKKNAVHGIIFRGVAANGRVPSQRPLATNPNIEQEQASFFNTFFANGGKYLKFVSVVSNGNLGAGDVEKVGKEYKVGVVVSVNVNELRKDLESAGIIKQLGGGF